MALTLSLRSTLTPPSIPSRATQPKSTLRFRLPPAGESSLFQHKLKLRNQGLTMKAVEESKESTESEAAKEMESPANEEGESRDEVSELGEEIKKAMMERKEKKEGDLLSGVGEEIQEIEWPAFGKVLRTTGVVLGVIAGSSVVLLTVNFVLAELSDKVFAGRGIQNFFG